MEKKITEDELDDVINKIIIDYLKSVAPLEWHKTAMDWNWDNDYTVLSWIVNNPETDKATALLIYWMSGPRWSKQFATREDMLKDSSWYANSFDFINDLERKYTSGFYTNQNFAYNPACDHEGYNWTDEYNDKPQLREIPKEMFVELLGETVTYPNDYVEGVPAEVYQKISDLIDEYDEIEEE